MRNEKYVAKVVLEIGSILKKKKLPDSRINMFDKRIVMLFALALKDKLLKIQDIREIYENLCS